MTESWPLLGDVTAEIGVDDLVGVIVLSADSNDSLAYLFFGESFFKVSSLDGSVMVWDVLQRQKEITISTNLHEKTSKLSDIRGQYSTHYNLVQ